MPFNHHAEESHRSLVLPHLLPSEKFVTLSPAMSWLNQSSLAVESLGLCLSTLSDFAFLMCLFFPWSHLSSSQLIP